MGNNSRMKYCGVHVVRIICLKHHSQNVIFLSISPIQNIIQNILKLRREQTALQQKREAKIPRGAIPKIAEV